MFTGLITDTARVVSLDRQKLRVECNAPMHVQKGQSIAVSGCCLTVVEVTGQHIGFDLNPETWQKTTFSSLAPGDMLNIEHSLRTDQLLDGHLVSGHVDTTGMITSCKTERQSVHYSISFDACFEKWVVEKGSITIDGISLTINKVVGSKVEVCVIPHTHAVTNLSTKNLNDLVNIEFDMMAKFFEKQIQPYMKNFRRENI